MKFVNRLTAFVLVLSVAFLGCGLVGCGDGGEPHSQQSDSGGTPPEPKTFELSESEKELELYDDFLLTVKDPAITEVTWESSDPSVAEVNGGKVIAKKTGVATITAKSADKTGSCSVSVVDLGAYPFVEVDNNDFTLKIGNSAFVNAVMKFKDKTVDAAFVYSSDDENIATFADGEIKAIGMGTTKVFVEGRYLDAHNTCEITVNVNENVSFTLDKGDICLYLSEPAEEFKMTETIIPEVYEDDKPVENPAILWEAVDTDAVNVENGVITAVKSTLGEKVRVKATYISTRGGEKICYVNVLVEIPEVNSDWTKAIELNADEEEDIRLDIGEIGFEIKENTVITDKEKEEDIPFTISDNNLVIKKSELYSGLRDWKFNLGDVIWNASVKVVTKYLRTAQDIANLKKYSLTARETEERDVKHHQDDIKQFAYYGYFELMNDINYGEAMGNNRLPALEDDQFDTNMDEAIGFQGTFEGNGHVISNYRPNGDWFVGLFRIIGQDAVVRNLALKDVELGCASGALAGIIGGTVDNVYVEGKSIGTNWHNGQEAGMVAARCIKTCKVSHVFVYMTDTENIDSENYSDKGTCFGTIDYGGEFHDVVGIGCPKGYNTGKRWGQSRGHDGAGITNFESVDDMKASTSFDGWDTEIWDFSGDLPQMKPQN